MWLVLTVAAGAAMPPDVNLDDVLRWESAAERLLEMPDGCWEWVGEAKWDWDVGRWGGSRGDAVFAGRTRDGTWGSVHLEPMGEMLEGEQAPLTPVYDATEARFAPLVGKFEGARVTVAGAGKNKTEADLEKNAAAANVLRVALDRLASDAYTSEVRWDDARGGVVLHRTVALATGDKQVVDYMVFFPDGGTLPTAIDLVFPTTFRTGRFPRWTIRDAQVHVRGVISGDRVFPTSEAFSFGFGIFGFRFHGAQTVRYRRVSRCPSSLPLAVPVPAPAAAAGPEETGVAPTEDARPTDAAPEPAAPAPTAPAPAPAAPAPPASAPEATTAPAPTAPEATTPAPAPPPAEPAEPTPESASD